MKLVVGRRPAVGRCLIRRLSTLDDQASPSRVERARLEEEGVLMRIHPGSLFAKWRRRAGADSRLALAFSLTCLAAWGTTAAGDGPLSTIPVQPTCFYETTVMVAGGFPDGCFEVEDITLVQEPFVLTFVVTVTDHWQPQSVCATVIVPYEAHETVGPLGEGLHTMAVHEDIESLRYPDFYYWIEFDVACCQPLPAPISDLRLALGDQPYTLSLSWTDAGDADSYTVYQSHAFDEAFTEVSGTVPAGAGGLDSWLPFGNSYYLVSGNNACGSGPLHETAP